MMAHRPLREPERLDEVANARFAVGLGLDQLKSRNRAGSASTFRTRASSFASL